MLHATDLIKTSMTMAIAWIIYVRTIPPPSIRHSSDLITYYGTMAMIWVRDIRTAPPDFMKHSPKIQDACGRTIKNIWGDRPDMPEWMDYKVYREMRVGCAHRPIEVATSSKMVVCNECGTGEKVYCDEICPICKVEYEEGNDVGVYKNCNHIFCKDCLKEWSKIHKTCPYCKCVGEIAEE
jgi:hypothetical protein